MQAGICSPYSVQRIKLRCVSVFRGKWGEVSHEGVSELLSRLAAKPRGPKM